MNSISDDVVLDQMIVMESPFGPLTLISDGSHLLELQFGGDLHGVHAVPVQSRKRLWCPALQKAREELCEYFEGRLQEFTVPFTMQGTSFQKRVWSELCEVPFGATCSYSQLAARVGSPQAARAVGVAMGRNPLAIIVPCHRVIGADGSLTGFGGGLDTKRLLLDHERRYL